MTYYLERLGQRRDEKLPLTRKIWFVRSDYCCNLTEYTFNCLHNKHRKQNLGPELGILRSKCDQVWRKPDLKQAAICWIANISSISGSGCVFSVLTFKIGISGVSHMLSLRVLCWWKSTALRSKGFNLRFASYILSDTIQANCTFWASLSSGVKWKFLFCIFHMGLVRFNWEMNTRKYLLRTASRDLCSCIINKSSWNKATFS